MWTNIPPPERYFNRKSRYALNLILVCDHTYRIRYFSARYPGSVHDSRIFNESHLKQFLQDQFNPLHPRFLLGDESFPCSNILLVPIRNDRADSLAQQRYNRTLRQTRWHVEAAFGVMKSRMRALLKDQRTALHNTKKVIKAMVILHISMSCTVGVG